METILVYILIFSIVFGYIFWPKNLQIKKIFKRVYSWMIWINNTTIDIISLLATRLKSVLSRINPLYFLLSLIAIILFFGLFKNEIQTWQLNNLPSIQQTFKQEEYSCKKEVNNPAYKQFEFDKVPSWVRTQCGKPIDLTSKHPLLYSLTRSLDCEDAWLATNSAWKAQYPKTIPIDSTCQRTIYESWFFAFGKYWFKI